MKKNLLNAMCLAITLMASPTAFAQYLQETVSVASDVTLTTATGVEKVAVTVPAAGGNKVYNLQGIRMDGQNLPAGIYVKNGKKFIVK